MFANVALDFQEIPNYMVTELNFPSVFLAGLFASIVFIAIVVIPFLLRGLGGIGIMFASMVAMLCVGLGWLDQWVIIVEVLAFVGLASVGIMKKVLK